MKHSNVRRGAVLALSLSVPVGLAHAAQARRAGAQTNASTVTVALKAAGQPANGTGPGTCTHAPKASIYGVVSEMWTVRHAAGQDSTQLTVWRPLDGKDPMFSLSLSGGRNIAISTVRGGTVTGSGTVKFEPKEKGGTFTVDAKARDGQAVSGTIQCSAFTPAVAEGG